MFLTNKILPAIFFSYFACSTVAQSSSPRLEENFKLCAQDEAKRKARSLELQQIVNADQEDRKDWQNLIPEQLLEMTKRDLIRRKRVGEIFGEGCFSTAKDYRAAALVFQHGDTPDHFYQTFIWAQRGVELGDIKLKDTMALGIDRFLVNTGKKQLFASQATTRNQLDKCFCLQQVEHSFSDEKRIEYRGRSLADELKWVDDLNTGKNCPKASECKEELKATPKGSLPGFW